MESIGKQVLSTQQIKRPAFCLVTMHRQLNLLVTSSTTDRNAAQTRSEAINPAQVFDFTTFMLFFMENTFLDWSIYAFP